MKKPTIFGKYLLLERVNVGGMAEVFIAKAFGVEGFERILAIKKILPTMAEDDEFIRMFIDEARISAQLSHANVVHINELGLSDGTYYIAMEYVSGRDLRTLQERYRRRKEIMPIAQAAFITCKVCEGLDYAHRKKDAHGEDLGIIHRDVSPQNILISYEGEVKIIDFGIAKAANRSQKTQAGILKGKFGYMSPEQVRGLPIDRRSDVFAVGVMLYEMLTGEKLFVGESDFSTLEKVRTTDVPSPSRFNPNVPPGLEKVVLKALAREVEDRYQWAQDMQEDLMRFLVSGDSIYSSKHLAAFMKEAFAEEISREAGKMERYASTPRPEQIELVSDSRPSRRQPVVASERTFTTHEQPQLPPLELPRTTTELEEMVGGADKTQIFDPTISTSAPMDLQEDDLAEGQTRVTGTVPVQEDAAPAQPEHQARSSALPPPPPDDADETDETGQAPAGATVVFRIPTPPPEGESQATRLTPPPTLQPVLGPDDEPPATVSLQPRRGTLPPAAPPPRRVEPEPEQPPEQEEEEEPPASTYPDLPAQPAPPVRPGAAELPPQWRPTRLPPAPPANRGPPVLPTVSKPSRNVVVAVAVAVALFLLLGGLGLLLSGRKSSGSLMVNVTPVEGAQVVIGGHPVDMGTVLSLPEGSYEVSASAPGYQRETRQVEVVADQQPRVESFTLVPEAPANPAPAPPQAVPTPEQLAEPKPEPLPTQPVQAQPPPVPAQPAPAASPTPTPAAGAAPQTRATRPVEREPAPRPTPAPQPPRPAPRPAPQARGALACSSRPSGAEVWVDNKPTGRVTPITIHEPLVLPVGSHKVVFKLDGKQSAPKTVNIVAGEAQKLLNVELK
jgi:eukaryotic-like serine/threonine-protein kinase